MDVDSQEILNLSFEWSHIAFLELPQHELFIRQKYLFFVIEMPTLRYHLTRVLKAIKQKLQSFTARGIRSFVFKEAREYLFTGIQERTVRQPRQHKCMRIDQR